MNNLTQILSIALAMIMMTITFNTGYYSEKKVEKIFCYGTVVASVILALFFMATK